MDQIQQVAGFAYRARGGRIVVAPVNAVAAIVVFSAFSHRSEQAFDYECHPLVCVDVYP